MNINKYTLDYFFLCGAGFCLLLATVANAAPPAKISVCQPPPGDPENTQLIQVGANGFALEAHLAHGDWMASEEVCDAIADNNCDGVAGTQAEDDASCNDDDPTTDDSCVAVACVSVVACPCDFSSLTLAVGSWTATPTKDILSQTCFPTNNAPAQANRKTARIDGPNAGAICRAQVDGVITLDASGLTNAQLNACAADLDTFANALDAEGGITVSNVDTACQTY